MALNVQERNELLKEVIFELSETQNILEDADRRGQILSRLEQVYTPGEGEEVFRHFYSDIFSWLTEIDVEGDRTIVALAQNLEILQREYRPHREGSSGNLIDIQKNLNKLCDHVNLDVSRITYLKSSQQQLEASLQVDTLRATVERSREKAARLEEDTRQLREQIQQAKQTAAEAEKSVRNAQKESTAILGIFAAIVLAFTGGMIFSTSVFENLGNSSIYRVALMAVVIAFALINIIYMLLRFVASMEGIEGIGFKLKWVNITLAGIVGLILLAWVIDLPLLVQKLHTNLYG